MAENEQGIFELPGLELELKAGSSPGQLRIAVTETIKALHTSRLLEPRHVALCQLALVLADSVESATRGSKAYAVAQASAQLRETLAALPAPSDEAGSARFDEFVLLLRKAGNGTPSA